MSDRYRLVSFAISLMLFSLTQTAQANEKIPTLPSMSIVIENAPAAPALNDLTPLHALKTNSLSFFDYQQLRLGQPMNRGIAQLHPESSDSINIKQSHALEKRITIKQSFDRVDFHTSYRLIAHQLAPDKIDEIEVTHFSSTHPRPLLQQKLQHALTNKFGRPLSFAQLKARYLESLSRELQIKQTQLIHLKKQVEHSAAMTVFVERQQWRILNLEQKIVRVSKSKSFSAHALCKALKIDGRHCHLRGTARADENGVLIFGHQPCRIWLRQDHEMLSLCQAAGAVVVRITSPGVSRSNQLHAQARLQQLEINL